MAYSKNWPALNSYCTSNETKNYIGEGSWNALQNQKVLGLMLPVG